MATENETMDSLQSSMELQLTKLFEAMDIIAAKNIESLQFDKTVKCSITDATNSSEGEYTVTDGSSTFKAYSESATYSNGASVYVSIPNGDYNNRKLIVGRYDESRSDYNADDPESGYIDITQNLITDFEGEKGLIANGDVLQTVLWDSGEGFDYQIDNKDDEGYKAYKQLLVKGKFKSWLGRKNILLGNYGLRVDILVTKENTTSQSVSEWYIYKLDSSNMVGDPFNYEVGFEQKITFNLDPEVNINRVRVVFYQDGNFYNKSKTLITPSVTEDIFVSEPYVSFGYAMEDFDEDTILLYTFNSDKYAEYLTDKVKESLVSVDCTLADLDRPEIYTAKLDKLNQKKIILRWIHETTSDDDITRKFTSICEEDDVPEEAIVHWYKYNLQEGISDELAGAFWEEIEEQKNKFEYTFSPNTSKSFEMFRVIVEHYSRDYVQNVVIVNDDAIIEIEEIPEEDRTEDDVAALENLKNAHLEKINTYISEDLVFTNENAVPDSNTIDLIKGLEITCDDAEGGYNGVYRIYDDSGSIMSVAESTKKRILTANYTSIVSGVESLDTAEKIIWKIPLENTMIYAPTEGTEYSFYDSVGRVTQEVFDENKDDYYIYVNTSMTYEKATSWNESTTYYTPNRTEISIEDGYFVISRYGVVPDASAGTEEADSTQQYFRIKDYYTQSAINNTVYCSIVKNNRTYSAGFDMTFGPCGTNGTDFTFTMEFENKQPAITCTDDEIKIVPKIYDYQNNDVTSTYVKNIKYSWYSSNEEYSSANKKDAIEIKSVDSSTGIVTLKLNTHDMESLNYFILRGCASDVVNIKDLNRYTEDEENVDGSIADETKGDYRADTDDVNISLYSYLPIPIRRTDEYITFDGANKIAYDTSGVSPQYFQDPYMIYHYENAKTIPVQDINWMMSFGKDTQSASGETSLRYYPTLDSADKLVPTAMFLQENGKQISVVGYSMGDNGLQFEWIQPLYIYQNVFSSSLLNSWDGSLTFDEENGTILSTMIGAGKKDSQNRFNGVLMGDLSPAFNRDYESLNFLKDYYSGIGLYGFNEGEKSFGLNINGRAFFGRSGKGQILIDGNSGTIQSQHFLASMKGFYNSGEDEPTDVTKAGMRIDLDNGILETYGLNSTAMIKIDPTAGSTKEGVEGTGPYFIIRSSAGDNSDSDNDLDKQAEDENPNGTNLLYVGKKNYYLQSHNFTTKEITIYERKEDDSIVQAKTLIGRGIKFDLMKGSLTGYDFSLKSTNSETGSYIELNSEGTNTKPYLRIHGVKYEKNAANENILAGVNDILFFSNEKQIIRSLDYDTGAETGTEFNLTKGKISSYDFTLKAIKDKQGIIISSSGSPYIKVQAVTDWGDTVDLMNISNGTFVLQSRNFTGTSQTGTDGNTIEPGGIKIDFTNNKFTAYEFKLEAKGQADTEQEDGTVVKKTYTFLIDSGASEYPLKIGTRFSVGWAGNIKADYIEATAGGKIGCFTISNSSLYIGTKNTIDESTVYLGSSGVSVGSGRFKATSGGSIYLTGTITGVEWSVDSDGKASFNNIYATGGEVGGWTLSGKGVLTNGTTKLSSNGLDFASNYLHSDELKFADVILNSEKIQLGGVYLNNEELFIDVNTYFKKDCIKAGEIYIEDNALYLGGGAAKIWMDDGFAAIYTGASKPFVTNGEMFGSTILICKCKTLECGSGGAIFNGPVQINEGIIENGSTKKFGKLAFEDDVSKKVNVTLTGSVPYKASDKTVTIPVEVWAHLENGEIKITRNSTGGEKEVYLSFNVSKTATGENSSQSFTIKATTTSTNLTLTGSSENSAAITMTNKDFSNVSVT